MTHAFAVLDVIPLYNERRTRIEEGLLMIRDPNGRKAMTMSNKKWNVNDTQSWTENYKS